ncbi:hypothetical protein PMAC_000448 [Pneumocystis sp. 'macacae']|nr:hypothetical protein PMAC_000448 [Pneumocystis sp. 'macacae']
MKTYENLLFKEKIKSKFKTEIIAANPNQKISELKSDINNMSILNLENKEIQTLNEQPNLINTLFNHTVGIIMKKGKKTKAQKQLENVFINIKEKTNTNPHFIFSKAIEKASPLIKLVSAKRGSKSIKIPIPLNKHQQHRKAIVWIIEASNKRHNRSFSERLAQELIAVVDGTSSVFQKKEQLHKLALVHNSEFNYH